MNIKLNLGCGNTILDGYINIDKKSSNTNVMICDLENALPFDDNSTEYIIAHHVLEHIINLDNIMHEIYRVCKNGSYIDVIVPMSGTLWAVADPSHVRQFNHKTFYYYSENFITSYDHPQYFRIISQNLERDNDDVFENMVWKVANLHSVLMVVK